MIEVHRIRCGNVNCYMIENGTNAILVDTGKKEYAAHISEVLHVPIGMSEKDCDLIESNTRQELFSETLPGRIVLPASLKDFSARPVPAFRPDILLKDKDSLSDYGIHAVS